MNLAAAEPAVELELTSSAKLENDASLADGAILHSTRQQQYAHGEAAHGGDPVFMEPEPETDIVEPPEIDVESMLVRNASRISDLERTLSSEPAGLSPVARLFGSSCGTGVAEFWTGAPGAPRGIVAEARHRSWQKGKQIRKLTLNANGRFILAWTEKPKNKPKSKPKSRSDEGTWSRDGGAIKLDYENWDLEKFSSDDNGFTFQLVWTGFPKKAPALEGLRNFTSTGTGPDPRAAARSPAPQRTPMLWCQHPDCIESIECFVDAAALREHTLRAHPDDESELSHQDSSGEALVHMPSSERRAKYTHGQHMPVSEDLHNEFKDISYTAAIQLIAKYVTAFLNTGRGGTVFFGVHDTGVVSGMKFPRNGSKDEDHFRMAVGSQLTQKVFGPPIQDHVHYRLDFEPVLEDLATITCVVELVVYPRERWPPSSQACQAWLVKHGEGLFKYYRRDQSMVQSWPQQGDRFYAAVAAQAIRDEGDYADQPTVTVKKNYGGGRGGGSNRGAHGRGGSSRGTRGRGRATVRGRGTGRGAPKLDWCDVCKVSLPLGGKAAHDAGKKHLIHLKQRELTTAAIESDDFLPAVEYSGEVDGAEYKIDGPFGPGYYRNFDDPGSLTRMSSVRRRSLAYELNSQMQDELYEFMDTTDLEEELEMTDDALDEEAKRAFLMHQLQEEMFEVDVEAFHLEVDSGELHLQDEQRSLLAAVQRENEQLRIELDDEEVDLTKGAIALGQKDKAIPPGTRLQYRGRQGTVTGFTRKLLGANAHLVEFDDAPAGAAPTALNLRDSPQVWSVIGSYKSTQPSPMSSVKSPGVGQPSWALQSPREQVITIWMESGRDDKVADLEELIEKAGGEVELLRRVREKYQPEVAALNARISASDLPADAD